MTSRRLVLGHLVVVTVLGCGNTKLRAEPGASAVDAGSVAVTSAAASASAAPSPAPAPPKAAPGACSVSPLGGVPIPASASATDVRVATASGRALVTWSEALKTDGREGRMASIAHVFDGASVGPRVVVASSEYGDEPLSGAAPVVVGSGLEAVSCLYGAPAGNYGCTRGVPGQKGATKLLGFGGISVGGPTAPSIAALVRGDITLVFVPDAAGKGVHAFSTRVSGKKKAYPFATPEDGAAADGLVAVDTSGKVEDGFAVVYRHRGAVKSRRVGAEENWRAAAIELSAKGALVGAPSAATDLAEGGRFVVLFSQRKKPTDDWRVRYAAVWPNGEVIGAELPTGDGQAQGPGITPAGPNCWLASWVEGSGKATRTRLARVCDRQGKPEMKADAVTTLTADGVEGGRAYLATDPANPRESVAVWQELPAGKPAELRAARVACP